MSGTSSGGQIDFAYTPSNILVPMISMEMDNSQANFDVATQVGLCIGQTLVAQPMKAVCVFSPQQAISLFGRGSMLARAVAKWLLNDTLGYVWCLPVPDVSAGVAATGTMTFSATTALAGTLPLYIAGQNIPVGVNAADTAAAIANSTAAAINAAADLPVTATVLTNVVTLLAKWKGVTGNAIDIRFAYYGTQGQEALPGGVSVAVAAMAGGAQDPDLTGVAAAIGDVPFDFICSPYSGAAQQAAFALMMNFSTGRWSPLRKVWGHVWSAAVGVESALAAITGALNDAHGTVITYEPSPTPPWEMAAAVLATAAPPIRNQPNAPLTGRQVQGVMAPAIADRFTFAQQQALLSVGGSPLDYDQAGNAYILRAISTYQENQFGQPDQSYLDAPTLYGIAAGNRLVIADLASKLANFLLAENGTRIPPGINMITPNGIKALLAGSYQLGEDLGLYQDIDGMLTDTIVQINAQNPGRADILFCPRLVYGLYNTAIKNQFRFVTGATAAAA